MPAPPRRTAWRSTLEGQIAILRLLELDMRRFCGISLAWYDVLVHLSEGGGMRRMNELADCLVLSRSWLTRRILPWRRPAWCTVAPPRTTLAASARC